MAPNAFVDPRNSPSPRAEKLAGRVTAHPEELDRLHQLCREGRHYDIEQWIGEGHPLQITPGTQLRGRRRTSALEIALERGNQALAFLLLCNGYDPDLESECPLDAALRSRRWDLLDLLLAWGSDPRQVSLDALFGTYNSALFERFRSLGVDLTALHEMAAALAYHSSNKPLFGFAKRHRVDDPRIQTELNMALAHHVEEGSEKGVQLCLWAGANPHAPAPSLRYPRYVGDEEDEAEEDRFLGFTAVYEACSHGHAEILERLGPDPALDDFDDLYRTAGSGAIVNLLARHALPRDVGTVIIRQMWWINSPFDHWGSRWRAKEVLERLFDAGARWLAGPPHEIASLRRDLLEADRDTFVDLMKLLAKNDRCSPEILRELARTPSMRARMTEVGFIPRPSNEREHYYRPTRSQEVLAKFGVELPKPKPPEPPPELRRAVQIGLRRPGGREVTLDRPELFRRVWSQPMTKLSEEWSISGPGLAKACRRLRIPVPTRGYWARLNAGQRIPKPRLPQLPPGEAEEIIICLPA